MLKPAPTRRQSPNPFGSLKRAAVAGSELAAFENDEAARRLAALAGDSELVLRLALQSYEGPEWIEFARALAEYGVQVMRAWIATGVVFAQCAKKGILLQPRPRDDDDASEMANETVARAIRGFKEHVLKKNRWTASKGASLKTFFIGQCLLRFANVYRRWQREQCRPAVGAEIVAQELEAGLTIPACTRHKVELARQAVRLERDSPGAIAAVMELGFSAAEIAEVLELSLSAVENRLYHYRKAKQG